jgi:hypothetical protein
MTAQSQATGGDDGAEPGDCGQRRRGARRLRATTAQSQATAGNDSAEPGDCGQRQRRVRRRGGHGRGAIARQLARAAASDDGMTPTAGAPAGAGCHVGCSWRLPASAEGGGGTGNGWGSLPQHAAPHDSRVPPHAMAIDNAACIGVSTPTRSARGSGRGGTTRRCACASEREPGPRAMSERSSPMRCGLVLGAGTDSRCQGATKTAVLAPRTTNDTEKRAGPNPGRLRQDFARRGRHET